MRRRCPCKDSIARARVCMGVYMHVCKCTRSPENKFAKCDEPLGRVCGIKRHTLSRPLLAAPACPPSYAASHPTIAPPCFLTAFAGTTCSAGSAVKLTPRERASGAREARDSRAKARAHRARIHSLPRARYALFPSGIRTYDSVQITLLSYDS